MSRGDPGNGAYSESMSSAIIICNVSHLQLSLLQRIITFPRYDSTAEK